MKPAPLTSAQLLAAGYNSGDPEGLIEFAQGVSDARDAQWEQMLAGQPVAAWRCTNWSGSPDDYIYRDADDCAVNAKGEKCGEPLYTAPHPEQPNAEPVNQVLLEALKVLVDSGGIGPEDMFDDARDAIAAANEKILLTKNK